MPRTERGDVFQEEADEKGSYEFASLASVERKESKRVRRV